MKVFNQNFIDDLLNYTEKRKPDFNNILKVLAKQRPSRYTLFEFFLNGGLYTRLAGRSAYSNKAELLKIRIDAFRAAGYDYVTIPASDLFFPCNEVAKAKSYSLNDGAVIFDRESFLAYDWPDPDDFAKTSLIEELEEHLPEGMKFIVSGPGGVLENAVALLGYENMCYLTVDDPDLLLDVFDNIGSRIVRYYELALKYGSVGAFISNDDWGFATQTMLSVADMRKYVFPWHKKLTETIHGGGRPVLLHSCGNAEQIYDDMIDVLKYDGKHSYEDKIMPVEQAYEKLNPRIAVLGGLDMDFVCRRTPEEIYNRACEMLKRTERRGGYALGTGNSVPDYLPDQNYFAMIAAAIVN